MKVDGLKVTMKGTKGTLELTLPTSLGLKQDDGKLEVTRSNDIKPRSTDAKVLDLKGWTDKLPDLAVEERREVYSAVG